MHFQSVTGRLCICSTQVEQFEMMKWVDFMVCVFHHNKKKTLNNLKTSFWGPWGKKNLKPVLHRKLTLYYLPHMGPEMTYLGCNGSVGLGSRALALWNFLEFQPKRRGGSQGGRSMQVPTRPSGRSSWLVCGLPHTFCLQQQHSEWLSLSSPPRPLPGPWVPSPHPWGKF